MDLTTPPIIFGAIIGVFFLIVLMYIVARICASKRRSERYPQQHINTAAAGPNSISNINAQFNNPAAAAGPTFAPAANYSLQPGYQYPANPPHHLYQQHYQNFNSGAVSSYTSPPMPQPDAPPSYSEVVAHS